MLLVVFVAVAVMALAGSMVASSTDAHLSGLAGSLRDAQVRALAWSGVQAVVWELARQRDDILAGRTPRLTPAWELFVEPDGTRGIVRLVPLDADVYLESESARLDVNTATAEMLGRVPGFDAAHAQAIVSGRQSRTYVSVEQALRGIAGQNAPHEGAWRRLLTAHAFEPNVQFGIGPGGAERRGLRRVQVGGGWTDALASVLGERIGAEAAPRLRGLFTGSGPRSASALADAVRRTGLDVRLWPILLDMFTFTADPYIPGRVDLNRAEATVLACLPGITPDAADRIVHARQYLDEEMLASPAWLVIEGLVTPEQFVQAFPYLTTRSFQWRARVEAGVAAGDQALRLPPHEVPLKRRVCYELVVDVSSRRPRIAYLRDITLAHAAETYAATLRSRDAFNPSEMEDPAGSPDPLAVFPGPSASRRADDNDSRRMREEGSSSRGESVVASEPLRVGAAARAGVDVRWGRWRTGDRRRSDNP